MGSFKDFDKKAPPPGAQPGSDRKNDEEIGEPVQLPDESPAQPQKSGKGNRGKARGGGGEEHANR